MKDEYDFSRGKRGAVVPISAGKTRITIVIDDEVLEWFRAQVHKMGGGDYQTLINTALRGYIRKREEPFSEIMKRMTREDEDILVDAKRSE